MCLYVLNMPRLGTVHSVSRPEDQYSNLIRAYTLFIGSSPGATNTLERWYQRSLMGDDVGELRTQVMEQALAIDELKQTIADAEKRRQKSHQELLRMMETLLLQNN